MGAEDRNVEAVYPLTPAQEGILFHVLYEASAPMYVQQYSVALDGDVDADTLKQSWDLVIERHQALRALFLWEGRERPLQIIRSDVAADWAIEDWRAAAEADQGEMLATYLEKERDRGFALDKAPLMRFGLFRLADDQYRFVWSHHHLILDGWSLGIVMSEVLDYYRSLLDETTSNVQPPIGFGAYIEWLQDRDDADRQASYWNTYLAGFDRANMLPSLGEGPHRRWADRQAEHTHRIDPDLNELAKDFAKREGLTLSTIMRGAWAQVLSRYTGDDDVVFGTTFSGRPPDLHGSLEAVGLFINTLPVRVRIVGNVSVSGWLRQLQQDQAEMTDFESTPLVEVKRHSDIDPDQELFESILVMENIPDPARLDGPFSQSDAHYHQQSNYPLAVLVMPGQQLELVCLYDDRRLTSDLVSRMMEHLEIVMREVCTRPDEPANAIRVLSREELEHVLIDPNRMGLDVPDTSILGLIQPHFDSKPDSQAIASPEGSVSYGELDRRSSALARRLLDEGVRPGDRVGIEMRRSPGMVVAMLAVMKTRAGYVPLDPGLPKSRLEFILEDTEARALVTSKSNARPGVPTLFIDEVGLGIDEQGGTAATTEQQLPRDAAGEDFAYVMYTSGSTGEPKGVEITQHNLLASTLARISYYDSQPGRYLVMSPFTFDSSVAGIYWTLATGGTLVLPEPDSEGDVLEISRLIQRERVTHTLTLPTLYQLMLEMSEPANLGSLEVVIVAGEACPAAVVDAHVHMVEKAKLFNEYGPTEGTVWATVERLGSGSVDNKRVSIGRPVPGAQIYLLDSHFRPVPVGVKGEICIGGAGLARGYLGRPGLTQDRFPTLDLPVVGRTRLYRTGDVGRWRSDGRLELIGRIDHQVKIRGQRVELEEIEANIRSHPDVSDAVVTTFDPELGSTQLLAYVDGAVEGGELRRFLTSLLPEVMIPTRVVGLSPIPKLSNGKPDRKGLPEPEPEALTSEDPVAPSGEAETLLAQIWADVLGREMVGAMDNFFELGGDSILSIRIVARAYEAGLIITPRQFFEHPTVSEMAAVAETA